jgi:hypothetical protein
LKDPNRSYLFGSHPHGLLCSGAFCAFATDALNFSKVFPGLTSRWVKVYYYNYWIAVLGKVELSYFEVGKGLIIIIVT